MARSVLLAVVLASLFGTTACSEKPSETSQHAEAPDIALTAAPGVAFSYDYRFGIDALKIATMQERHAAACEALGTDKCRITGLSFSRQGRDQATGVLELALAPDLARKFGKDAIAAVEAARGNVSSIEIEGVDQTPVLERSAIDTASAKAEREKLEAEIRATGISDARRSDLLRRIEEQKLAERSAKADGDTANRALANTPMRFTYSTDGFLPGISIDRTTWAALGFAGMLLNALLALIVVLGVLAIPVGLGLVVFAHGRRLALRLWRWLAPRPESEAD